MTVILHSRYDNINNPEVKRLLGKEGNLHNYLGLDSDWAYNIIYQVGNYAQSFDPKLDKFSGITH